MNEKAEICRSAGIKLECELEIDGAIGVSGVELCSLFSNVMDNAVSGCRNSGAAEMSIKITAAVKKGYLVLECVNTAGPEEDKHGHTAFSEHGWGLEILEHIASRREGKLETVKEAGSFETRAFLKCRADGE